MSFEPCKYVTKHIKVRHLAMLSTSLSYAKYVTKHDKVRHWRVESTPQAYAQYAIRLNDETEPCSENNYIYVYIHVYSRINYYISFFIYFFLFSRTLYIQSYKG